MGAGRVDRRQDGRVAIFELRNPPTGLLAAGVRRALIAALSEAEADPETDAIVLTGANGGFPPAINISEYDEGRPGPDLAQTCRAVEACSKPVVAAIPTHIAAAGLELALAAHARVVGRDVRVSFPDVMNGMMPSAGATQRLPRLCGARRSLDILLTGRRVGVAEEGLQGFADDVVPRDDVLLAAIDCARTLARLQDWQRSCDRRDGFADAVAYQKEVSGWRARSRAAANPLLGDILTCVESAQLLPFEAGLDLEQTLFEEHLNSDLAQGLRHAARAARRAGMIKGAGQPPKDGPVVILGGRGRAITVAAALRIHGRRITIIEPDTRHHSALRDALSARIRRGMTRSAATPQTPDQLLNGVRITDDPGALDGAAYVFDFSPDKQDVKVQALETIARITGPDATVLGATHRHDLSDLAPLGLSHRIVGLHIVDRNFSADLAELVVSDETDPAHLGHAAALMGWLGRQNLRVAPGDGLAGPTLAAAAIAAADELLRTGVSPYAVEQAMRGFGCARGPYGLLADMDVRSYLALQMRTGFADTFTCRALTEVPDLFRRWADPEMQDVMEALLADWVDNEADAAMPEAEIVEAIDAAVVNAAVGLLARDVIALPLAADVAMVHGYGYPRARGGPMNRADRGGLFPLVQRMRRLGDRHPELWFPHTLLLDIQRNGLTFAKINAGAALPRQEHAHDHKHQADH